MLKIICVGDPHIQVSNLQEFNIFMEKLILLCIEIKPDLIVVLGDTLHTHERLHTTALNKAVEFFDKLSDICLTYILVGNHDYIQNQQFLTENHWLVALKGRNKQMIIVDKVIKHTLRGFKFIFCPYVPNGRFIEALDTLGEKYTDANCIFAHQEFAGCKMGAIISVDGDSWPDGFPNIISGHIHSKQKPQDNIYYTGSALQHAFGESEKNIIACLTFTKETPNYLCEEVDLNLPRKKIVYIDIEDVEQYNPPITDDDIKLTISGSYEQFKVFKKTKKYKELVEDGKKVVFKQTKSEIKLDNEILKENCSSLKGVDFKTVLNSLIVESKNSHLTELYELVINGKCK